MMLRFAAIFALLGLWANAVSGANMYFMTFPKDLRPGMVFDVSIQFLVAPAEVSSVTLSIRVGSSDASDLLGDWAEETVFITPNLMTYYQSFDTDTDLYSGSTYYLHAQFSGVKVDNTSRAITCTRPPSPLFVVTDLPRYKPGDTVKFGAGYFDYELKPKMDAFKVQILAPDDTILRSNTMDPSDTGFRPIYQDTLELSEDGVLGTYHISMEGIEDGTYTKVPFKVEEYVLPKFEVTLSTGGFAVSENGAPVRITGTVTAKYTYGQDVIGRLRLTANARELYDDEFEGSYDIDLPLDGVDPSALGRTMLPIVAEVYEQHTDIMANATSKFTVYKSPISAQMVKPIPYRTSTETVYRCQVRIANAMGGQIEEWGGDGAASLDFTNYELRYSFNGQTDNYQTVDVSSSDNAVVDLEIPTMIDRVTVNFDQQIKVWFVYRSQSGRYHSSIVAEFSPTLYQSNSNEPLRVEMVDTENQDDVCFRVTPCQDGDAVFFQVINNFYPEGLFPCECDPVCFTPTRDHAPVSMIVAYKVVETEKIKELLSASAKFERPYSTLQQVSIEVTPGQVKPGESVNMRFSTRGPSYVHFAGVDKSTQLAQDPNDITPAVIEKKVTATRIFDTQENKYPNRPGPCFLCGRAPMFEDAVARKKREANKRAKRSDVMCWGCGYSYSRTDPGKIMQEAGMTYMSDLTVFSSAGGGGEDGNTDLDETSGGDLEPVEVEEEEIRKDFPETWLWDIIETNVAGEGNLDMRVPDTITSWVVKAFAFNAEFGLGVAAPAEVVVFKEFFLSMNLPYSVVRGERFDLQLLVFNYKTDSSIQVQVELEQNDGFEVVPRGRSVARYLRQSLTVEAGASGSVKIPIRPSKIGDLVLTGSATTSGVAGQATDAVERTLLVKPEGREVEDSRELTPVKFSNDDRTSESPLDMARFISEDQDYIIEDSFRMYMFVTGDMMGAWLNNLEGLMRMPYGCGEQNIMSLCPSIFVTMYLQSINRFDSDTRAKAQKYTGAGYMRQLKYKHTTGPYMGSYSAFGQGSGLCPCRGEAPDPNPGSTWLTAFVLKVFSLLALTDVTYVSRMPLSQAAAFLESTTAYSPEDNFFSENGTVIHTEMQGGTTSGATMTAYILSALMDFNNLLEADGDTQQAGEIKNLIQRGTDWLVLKRGDVNVTSIPYQLALVAYTFARASADQNDVIFQEALEMLGQYEEVKDNLPPQNLRCPGYMARPAKMVCEEFLRSGSTCRDDNDCAEGQKCCGAPCGGGRMTCQAGSPPYHQTGPTKIETLGYALMAYTQLADKARADPTMFARLKEIATEKSDLLLSMRKAGGIFASTQDTAVCLEALARYAMIFPSSTSADFSVQAISNGAAVSEWINVDSNSYIATQWAKLDVPSNPPIIDLTFVYDGVAGSAFVTVQALYNTGEDRRTSPFNVDVISFMDNKRGKNIRVCVRNADSNIQITSMVTVEMKMQSGHQFAGVPELDSAFTVNRLEEDKKDGTVTIYYLTGDDNFITSRCYTFLVEENYDVQDKKPGHITARDYYENEHNLEVSYTADFTSPAPTTEYPTIGCSHAQISLWLILLTLARAALAQ